jgi:hypothetical protein
VARALVRGGGAGGGGRGVEPGLGEVALELASGVALVDAARVAVTNSWRWFAIWALTVRACWMSCACWALSAL